MIQEPTQPIPSPVRNSATRHERLRLGVVIALIVALAIPVVAVIASNGNGLTPANLLAAGVSASPDASGKTDDGERGPNDGRGWKADPYAKPFKAFKDKLDKGRFGFGKGGFAFGVGRGRGGFVGGQITIRSIAGSQLSLATDDGWTRTIKVAADAVITKGGQTIAIGDLKVGDALSFGQTRNDDGTYTVTTIWVHVPVAFGDVTKVDGNKITIAGKAGIDRVITVNGATTYKLGDAAATKADVKVGTEIKAQGTLDGDVFTAISIYVELPHIAGLVTAKTTDSITVTQRDGSTAVIHIGAATTFKVRGSATPSLADIAVGDAVSAEGTLRANGSLDAVSVHAGSFKAKKPPKSGVDDDAGSDPA